MNNRARTGPSAPTPLVFPHPSRRPRRRPPLSLAAPLTLSLLLAAGCGSESRGETDSPGNGEETPPIPVEVAQVRRGDVFAVYSGTATVEAYREAEVVAKVGGEVRSLAVEEGDRVAAGQVLATLDGERLKLELEQARANLAKLEQDYRRNVELHEKGLLAAGAFENLKFDLDALKAAYELAKLEYGYTTITAPIDGVVSERMVKVGNTIAANTPVFRITDLDPLVAYLHVPEREFSKLAPGQQAELAIDAIPGKRYTADVVRISPVVDAGTGTFKVTLEVEDPAGEIKPGMFGRVGIVYDRRPDSLLVPRVAVMEDEAGDSVFVVRDGEVERRRVETGFVWRDELQIAAGLDDDERVVTVGQAGLRDGARVEVIEAPGAAGVASGQSVEAAAAELADDNG